MVAATDEGILPMNSQVEQRARELLDAETRPLRSYSACEPLYPESVALRAVAAALASQPPVLDEREGATLSPDPVLLGEVRQALEPFARLADAVDAGSRRIVGVGILGQAPDNALPVGGPGIRGECTITIGALIAARAAFAKLPKLTGEEV